MKILTTQMLFTILGSVIGSALLIGGCTGAKKDPSMAAAPKELNLAIWGEYLDPEDQKRFTEKTGIKVNITNYSSNEELLAKIQSGASNVDVAVPSDYMVGIMAKMGLLLPLDKTKITHFSEIDPRFKGLEFDPKNEFSVPYAWTTAGFAYHTELIPNPPKSWKELLSRKDLDGKISLLDDVRETLGAALKAQGASVNSTNPAELEKAKAFLVELKKKTKLFRSETVDSILRKEMALAHSYGTDALKAEMKSGGKVKFILPEEGGTWSLDNFVILKSAKNPEGALTFINFFLEPSANLGFVQRIFSGPVLKGTQAALPENLKNHSTLFPTEGQMKKLESIKDVGEATTAFDRIWTEVKSK